MIIFVCAHDGMCDNSGESFIFSHLHMGSRGWIQVTRLEQQAPVPMGLPCWPPNWVFLGMFATLEFEIDAVFQSLLVGKEKKVTR